MPRKKKSSPRPKPDSLDEDLACLRPLQFHLNDFERLLCGEGDGGAGLHGRVLRFLPSYRANRSRRKESGVRAVARSQRGDECGLRSPRHISISFRS